MDEETLYRNMLETINPPQPSRSSSSSSSNSKESENLRMLFMRESRSMFLQAKGASIPMNEELDLLYRMMMEAGSSLPRTNEHVISYSALQAVRQNPQLPDRCRRLISAKLFAMCTCLPSPPPRHSDKEENRKKKEDGGGGGGFLIGRHVGIAALFSVMQRIVLMERARLDLSYYDKDGRGFVTEESLSHWFVNVIHSFPSLRPMTETQQTVYIQTAVAKVFFLTAKRRTGVVAVAIKDIASSSIVSELSALRHIAPESPALYSNWFSVQSVFAIYYQFTQLDVEGRGSITAAQLSRFDAGSLTRAFIDRVFEVHGFRQGRMTHREFVEFLLVLMNPHLRQSLAYLFKAFDLRHVGYLSAYDINYFFKSMSEETLARHSTAPVVAVSAVSSASHTHHTLKITMHDVKDEIFDMCRPAQPDRITIDDVVAAGVGRQLVLLLTRFMQNEVSKEQMNPPV